LIADLARDSKIFRGKIGRLAKVLSEIRLKRLLNQVYAEGADI